MKRQNKADYQRPMPDLAQLAEHLESPIKWEDLTLPESDRQRLLEIASYIKHKASMLNSSGHSTRTGVIALFVSPNGPGKILAAAALANHLNKAIYRIDLSHVLSKYIGETDKNLRRVFDAAENGGDILFFDEADALFGKRSEVKDSHDRYADNDVNYLIQHMESYQGLTIISTNRKSVLYQALSRRLNFVIEFPGVADSKNDK